MPTTDRVSRTERLAAEILVERAEVLGRPIRPDVLASARETLRLWDEQVRADAEASAPAADPA